MLCKQREKRERDYLLFFYFFLFFFFSLFTFFSFLVVLSFFKKFFTENSGFFIEKR